MNRCISVVCILLALSFSARASIDTTIGLSVSKSDAKNYIILAHALCDGVSGDSMKANAIYNWITHNIKYDIKAVQSGKLKPDKVEKVLKNRLGVCDGYAKLFTAMCKEAGMKAVTVDGYAKDWIFDNGDELIIPRHAWSAVMIGGEWQLVDPTWGAGTLVQAPTVVRRIINKVTFKKITYAKKLKFVFRYDPQYFCMNPDSFRLKHLPADPFWQLRDTAMPLEVFEAGDSAVNNFNKLYHTAGKKYDSALLRIAALPPDSVELDAAERAYAFNNRFAVALAIKETARVTDDARQAAETDSAAKANALWKDAQQSLKIAESKIKEQKKYFPPQYTKLKKKNRVKNGDAKQGMMQIKTDDKKLVAQCTKYRRTADNKIKRVRKKYADAGKRKRTIDPTKIDDIEAANVQKSAKDPEMVEITDSLTARNNAIDSMQKSLDSVATAISAMRDSNSLRLDSLAKCLGTSDSLLVGEAKARIHMHDNYDDDVIMWAAQFKTEKYMKADTLHKNYLLCYDTILIKSDDWQKIKVAQMNAYKKNLKDAEKYVKWNNNDTNMHKRYVAMAENYMAAIDTSTRQLMITAGYIKAHKKLFYGLAKLYKRQLYIVKYMGNVEDMRKKLEFNTIMSKQALDNKENKQQLATIKNAVKQMERLNK